MMTKLTTLPSRGDKNEVSKKLQEAIDAEYDEVFIIGSKDGYLRTTYSGYKDIERKLGAIELLKFNMIEGAG
jgi:UDP-N-acetyl-D-mannosaminuronic acid transferase (WecB/TagA/CpsF family)